MNTFNFAGNIATDLQLRALPGEDAKPVVDLLLAVDKPITGADADFILVTVYGRRAEHLAEHNAKGSAVAIVGHVEMHRWQDQDGENRSRAAFVADRITYLGGARK